MATKDADAYAFAMGFIANSDDYRQQYLGRWEEIISNFLVEPDAETTSRNPSYQNSPYSNRVYRGNARNIILKDPETHKLVMTYASKLVRSVFGDQRGDYIQANPVGWEDAGSSKTVNKLLRYSLNLPGHFRTFVEAIIDMLLFGTSTLEVVWKYEERWMPVRSIESRYGIETSSETALKIPVYDDVCIRVLDVMDFYPDPSRYRLQDMMGAAKRFKMNAGEASRMVAKGMYKSSGVEDAIRGAGTTITPDTPSFREGKDQPTNASAHPDLKDMIGYEYWGEVPWDDDGMSRRVITILNNVLVRNDPYPLSDPFLPFHSFIINPVQGRFYGISPAEVVRWDQSFADAIKILLAEAIIRQVHPPIAFDPDADVDVAATNAWKADALISVRGGPNSIGTLQYGANIANGFAMLQGLKVGIQDTAGAPGGIQGEPGPARESATGASARLQFAMDRPELAAMVLENECLPPIGLAILRRYQQFLADTDDLKRRVGEQPEPIWLGDIMGDFDVQFVGSRKAIGRQAKLQSWDRVMAMAQSIPAFQMALPTVEMARSIIGDLLELPELAAQVGNPNNMLMNALAMQVAGGQSGAANNGVPNAPAPAGLPASQAAGDMVQAQ